MLKDKTFFSLADKKLVGLASTLGEDIYFLRFIRYYSKSTLNPLKKTKKNDMGVVQFFLWGLEKSSGADQAGQPKTF